MGCGDDPDVSQTVTWARQLGYLVGLYHWFDGTQTVANQLARVAKWVDLLHPDFVSIDHEQFWADWAEYWKYVDGLMTINQIKHLTDVQCDKVHDLLLGLQKKYPALYLMLYTGSWFSGFNPSMAKWIASVNLWVSSYKYYTPDADMTIGSAAELQTYCQWLVSHPPYLPVGATKWVLHQSTSSAIFPGTLSGPWDISYYGGSLEQFKALIGNITPPVVIPPVVPPTPTFTKYKVTASAIMVHISASVYANLNPGDPKRLPFGSDVSITDTATRIEAGVTRIWGKLLKTNSTDRDLWTCLKQDAQWYVQKV
jgi:hypothetical protein